MKPAKSDPEDDSSESDDWSLSITKRELLGTLAAAGVLGAGAQAASSGPANAGIGGGPLATKIEDLQIQVHEGTLADRPAAGVKGRYFRVEDPGTPEHGFIYRDTGTSWELLDAGFSQLQADVLNNADYWIDPSMSAADIRSVRDEAGENSVIAAEPGTYVVDSAELVDTDIRFGIPLLSTQTLVGKGLPEFIWADDIDDLYSENSVSIIGNADPANGNADPEVHGIKINGNKGELTGTGGNWECLNFKNVDGFVLRDIEIVNAPVDGMDLDDCSDGIVINPEVSDCGGQGVHPSVGCSNIKVFGGTVDNCDKGLSTVPGTEACRFFGVTVSNCRIAIRGDSPTGGEPENANHFINCTIIDPGEHGFTAEQSVGESVIDGCKFVRTESPASTGSAYDMIDLSAGADSTDITPSIRGGTEIRDPFIAGQTAISGIPSGTVIQSVVIEVADEGMVCQSAHDEIDITNSTIDVGDTAVDLNGATNSTCAFNSLRSDDSSYVVNDAGTGTVSTPNAET